MTRNKKTEGERKVLLEQWVEVRIRDGRTVTELYPGNAQLLEKAGKMDPPPELVYRRLNFPEGVPEEYLWSLPPDSEDLREYGGLAIQRMTFETWNDIRLAEESRVDGHIGPTGKGNLPRPKEHGPCKCRVCLAPEPAGA
jgi:hypothetical protein